MNLLKRRQTPQSVERQLPQKWATQQVIKAYEQEPRPLHVNEIPDDMPSEKDWFRIRIWLDEIEGRSLTL